MPILVLQDSSSAATHRDAAEMGKVIWEVFFKGLVLEAKKSRK